MSTMFNSTGPKRSIFLTALLCLSVTSAVLADGGDTKEDLAAQVKDLKMRLAQLEEKEKSDNDASWLSEERTAQIKNIVEQTLADARSQGKCSDGPDMGYNNGFFIQSADRNFKLSLNGYMQFRYTFADAKLDNKSSFKTAPKSGDASGFDFRYMRLTFSGNAFSPNLTYLITGDFAGNSTNLNNFQLVDAWAAYRFNNLFNLRVGAFLVPYSRLEYISSGLDFVDFPSLLNPFDPCRAFGVSLYGDIIKDKLTYEVNMNNGPQSNHNGRAAEIGGLTDNRACFAARVQYFGGTGKPSDFCDEADLRKDTSTLAWLVEGAVGYDSANTSSNAFPGKQGSETIPGVSTLNSPGFTTYPLNGDLFRGTIDASAKYQGFEFTTAAFFQQINENNGAGVTSGIPASGSTAAVPASVPAAYLHNSSFFQASYYAQMGYMITPQWEVVARVGQLLSEGGPNRMEEYSAGVNYYICGKNVKIQGDVTYIPNEAAISNTTFGTFANTQDFIARVQLQVKF